MSCVLRILGDFDPEPLLKKAGWDGDVTSWRKGDLNRKGIPFERSGILLTVSDAEFDQFEKQIDDAIDFLKSECESLRSILSSDGVHEGNLDFGSNQSKAPAYYRVFPAELIRLAGEIGLGLEISLYAVSGMGGFESMPKRRTKVKLSPETPMNVVDKAQQTQYANIEKKTGKSLAELAKLVKASGLAKHGEVVSMLKEKLKLGHGDANAVAHYAKNLDAPPPAASPDAATDEIYSGPKADLRSIHDAVMGKLAGFGEFEIAPKKGYLSLRRKKQFCTIGPATKTRVDIGINLKGVDGNDRFVAQPAMAMCQFKVGVSSVGEVDKDLVSWLKKAFDAAG